MEDDGTLRYLYRDNGAGGCNERDSVSGATRYDSRAWNPVYCIYGWAHLVDPQRPDRCHRCGTEKKAGASAV